MSAPGENFAEGLQANFTAPNHILVADRAGIQRVLVELDLVKAPFFDNMRLHPGNPMLVTERDKESHKRTVIHSSFSRRYELSNEVETTSIARVLHQLS